MTTIARKQSAPDMLILCFTIFFIMFGLIMIYSSSAIMAAERFGDSFLFLRKQLLWVGIGIAVMVIGMHIDYQLWQRYSKPVVFVSLASLVLVLLIGRSVGGAQRWLSFGQISVQPSEFAKLAMVIGLADFLDRKRSRVRQFWKGYIPVLIFIMLFSGLILAEPDLGTPLVMLLVGGSLFFLSATHVRYLVGTFLALIPFIYWSICMVPYRKSRILSFLNPWADPQGSGYQIIQSLVAFGSGGFVGKGLGASEAKLLYVPEPHTDFIFSIIGEELGLLGTLMILLLYAVFAVRGIMIARNSPNLFGSFLAAGITLTIVYQVLINIAVVSGCLPTKGLPLPFISFGGSSLIFTMAGVGILLNISKYTKQ